ncbi:phosphatidate cytidylyltransferase [Virgibacillus alimentarius]|uniref:Phosphatidate cytidylyltransferase n=1 Tax=Virgibacillus alimentarius TaxID=698769 RepID=A0ABS4S418_9BACI|nr:MULTISPECIES: phosphatidate cytidylyltransferase [Virgibacillus]MBP2256225.1 phosphatidate cytidylyltransferase [Virgibacillus alimentarius]HLR66172.1 phosphatidate cytidylyltransferase [Virgibacillus sp.]
MKQRIQTAILALIVFLPLVIYGEWPFTLFVYFLSTLALVELIQMRKLSGHVIPFILATALVWIILLQMPSGAIPGVWFTIIEAIVLIVVLLLGYTVLAKNTFTFDDAGFMLLAAIYVGIGFNYLIETRAAGLNYIFFVLFIIWATDTGAYFFGRAFGKRKLWPIISPNKTIEGAIGGVISACIVGVIFHLIYPFDFSMIIILGVTVFISVFGQIGDLVESAFKRHYDVKDSGKILPGHGGILDRLDSLLFVLPLIHFIHFVS